MISAYFNQSASWKAVIETDQYNEPTYADPADVDCRFEYKRKMVRNKEGQEVISEATLFTKSPIKPDDVITYDEIDWTILAVANEVGLDGTVEFYEVNM